MTYPSTIEILVAEHQRDLRIDAERQRRARQTRRSGTAAGNWLTRLTHRPRATRGAPSDPCFSVSTQPATRPAITRPSFTGWIDPLGS